MYNVYTSTYRQLKLPLYNVCTATYRQLKLPIYNVCTSAYRQLKLPVYNVFTAAYSLCRLHARIYSGPPIGSCAGRRAQGKHEKTFYGFKGFFIHEGESVRAGELVYRYGESKIHASYGIRKTAAIPNVSPNWVGGHGKQDDRPTQPSTSSLFAARRILHTSN